MLRRSSAILKMVPGVSGVLFTRTEYTELMSLARDIERRLEAVVEDFAGKVFRGALHPIELTSRLVREADLALLSSEIGPIAPNVFEVRVGPAAVPDDIPDDLLAEIVRRLSKWGPSTVGPHWKERSVTSSFTITAHWWGETPMQTSTSLSHISVVNTRSFGETREEFTSRISVRPMGPRWTGNSSTNPPTLSPVL
jgi:hypothetical protein